MVHLGYRIFNTIFEEYKVISPERTSDYITKDYFNRVLLYVNY